MNRFSIFCFLTLACASIKSQAAVPELDLSVNINSDTNEFSAEAMLKLEACKKYIFELAPGLAVDSTEVDAVVVHTRKIRHANQCRWFPKPA
jgi:hypothetical protein